MIQYNKDSQYFHLTTKSTSYVLNVLKTNHLGHLYYGRRIDEEIQIQQMEMKYTVELGSSTTYSSESSPFSLNVALLEASTYGKGDYRDPMIHLEFEDGSRVSDFLYEKHKIIKGKPPIEDLPQVYTNDVSEAETLVVTLIDSIVDVSLELSYSVFEDADVIVRSLKIVNGNTQKIQIQKAMSVNFDHHESYFDLITLDGAWIKERQLVTRELQYGITKIDSKKGVSSADHNPFIALKRKNTDESMGECYGFALVYSGSFEATVEVNPQNLLRVLMGINSFDFKWLLDRNQEFQTPEVVMTYSNEGLNKLSQNYHKTVNKNIVRGAWKEKPRPILINNWEATYFDFTERKLLKIAKNAKKLGMELFVLDDGWFGKRTDDKTSLGDWTVNKKKLPNGITGLCKKINRLGLEFGIWVEPEMISIDSNLFQNHPNWMISLPNRNPSPGRNQFILDFSKQEVQHYIINSISDLLSSSNIAYCKWDMNRNFSDLFSSNLKNSNQSELLHRYVLGLYSVLEQLHQEFPNVLFESCSSGGNRFDLGMLYYMPQTWTSDNSDAIERLNIQYGTSMLYPLSTMGAHVSASPNHQVLRTTPIETRFNVSAFGLLGYELDLSKLKRFEKAAIKNQIIFYKEHRNLLQFGTFYRIKNPFEENVCIWMVVNRDQTEALLGYYQKLAKPNPGYEKLPVVGVDSSKKYQVTNRVQYMNIHQIGDLVSQALPIRINSKGVIFTILANNYLFKQENLNQTYMGSLLLNDGITPFHQFTGTGYNDFVRIIGDFGSRIYYIKENIHEQRV